LRRDCYSLLVLGQGTSNPELLVQAFRSRGVPFATERLLNPRIREVYGRDFVLVRPDLHVAWRGDHMPEAPESLVARVTGQA